MDSKQDAGFRQLQTESGASFLPGRIEPIRLHLAVLLGAAIVCLLLLLYANRQTDKELEKYTRLQARHHTLSEVSLITQKSLLRIQIGFENLLLSASEAELNTARDAVLKNMENLYRAVKFFEEGGSFKETIPVNFDGLEEVSHTFQIEEKSGKQSIATIEMRSSLNLLEQALIEYYRFSSDRIADQRSIVGKTLASDLVLMHKKLNPFFDRALEYSNRFYVQSMDDLKRATDERNKVLLGHRNNQLGVSLTAFMMLIATGILVFRSANRILYVRNRQNHELALSNTHLRSAIDERLQVEAALQKSEERLRLAMEATSDGLWDWDLQTGAIYWSPKAYRMLGYDPDEFPVTFDTWRELVHPEDRERVSAEILRQMDKEGGAYQTEFRFRNKSGGWHWVIGRGKAAERDAQGAVLRMLGTHVDITDRVKTEEALKQSERQLRNLYELAPIGIYSATPDGKYVKANRALAEMYGYASPEELIKNVNDISKDVYADQTEWPALRSLLTQQGQITNYEILHKTKYGKTIWGELNVRSVRDDTGNLAYYEGFCVNISRRKEAELADRKNQNELRKLWKAVEHSPATIIITDSEGSIQYVNPQFSKLTGYSVDEVMGRNPKILKSGYHNDAFFKDMWRTLHNKSVWRGELCNRKKNGELYWAYESISPIVDPEGMITNYVAVKEDITERIRRDAELKSALSELEAIFNSSSVGIAHLDAGLSVLRVNAFFVGLFGLTAPELHVQGLASIFAAPEEFSAWVEEHREPMAKGEMIKAEWQLRSRFGQIIWCSVGARAIDLSRKDAGSIWVFDDITSRIDLESMRADVERIMRHDLKAPLNGIINLPILIAEESAVTPTQQEMLDLIRDAGERMLNQIELSLDLYRMESGTFEMTAFSVDMVQTAHKAFEVIGPSARARKVAVDITVEGRPVAPDDRVGAVGSELLCHNILINLLKNAVEASSPGGRVAVDLGCAGGWSRMSIHNEGLIPPEIRPVFFDKYTTSGKKGGTGLGTYSARLMTESQGGRISFTCEEGYGVTVLVELPSEDQGTTHE